MPIIFDDNTKKKLQIQMLENGFSLIKKYGLKKTSVEDITRISGIAKGTFYNFFKSKEDFVHEIVLFKRDQAKKQFQLLLNVHGKMEREQFKNYLEILLFDDYNLFSYLSQDDIAVLKARWPKEYFINDTNDETTSLWILSHIENISPHCNWKIFANYIKSIAIIQANKENLYEDAYKETIDMLINNILDYLYANLK